MSRPRGRYIKNISVYTKMRIKTSIPFQKVLDIEFDIEYFWQEVAPLLHASCGVPLFLYNHQLCVTRRTSNTEIFRNWLQFNYQIDPICRTDLYIIRNFRNQPFDILQIRKRVTKINQGQNQC